MTAANPFRHGNPVPPDQLVGRKRERRRLASRIVTGQSSALIGEPRMGKTSLLDYLRSAEHRDATYGEAGENLLFSYLDAQGLDSAMDSAKFWACACAPLENRLPHTDKVLQAAYAQCQASAFDTYAMSKLLQQVAAREWRLILLLDEFDTLLHHPELNSAGFFGGLRALSTRSRGALGIIIAGRRSLVALNEETQQFSRTSSPYFNFLSEVTLGPLSARDAATLLNRAGERFAAEDRRFVLRLGGGHPYLLQAAASALWDAYAEGLPRSAAWPQAVTRFREDAKVTLSDTWRLWSPAYRLAFIAAGIDQITAHAMGEREFHERRLLGKVRDLGPELRTLEKQGFIRRDNARGWDIYPQAFLWWLADEIIRLTRNVRDPAEVLRVEQWEGMLTQGEKQYLHQALRVTGELLKDGTKTLIQGVFKEASSGITTSFVG